MLRSYASTVEHQLAIFDQPIPPLLAVRIFAPCRQSSSILQRDPQQQNSRRSVHRTCASLKLSNAFSTLSSSQAVAKPSQSKKLRQNRQDATRPFFWKSIWRNRYTKDRDANNGYVNNRDTNSYTKLKIDEDLVAGETNLISWRFVPWASPLSQLSKEWNENIIRLVRWHRKEGPSIPREKCIAFGSVAPLKVRAAVKAYYAARPSEFWTSAQAEPIHQTWLHMMLQILAQDSQMAVTFLGKSLAYHTPDVYQVVDVLHLATRDLHPGQPPPEKFLASIWKTLETVHDVYSAQDPPMVSELSQNTLLSILKATPSQHVARSYFKLLNLDPLFHAETLLDIADMLSEAGFHTESLEVLTASVKAGLDPKAQRSMDFCSKMLRNARARDGEYETATGLLTGILKLGVSLDAGIFNALIVNAVNGRDTATAWQIWDTLLAKGVEPDAQTYMALMRLCRRMNDDEGRERFRYLYTALNPDARYDLDMSLVTEILRCKIDLLRNVKASSTTWQRREAQWDDLLNFFEDHCDLGTLKDLGIVNPDRIARSIYSIPQPRPFPKSSVISVMIDGYLEYVGELHPKSNQQARKLYNRFLQQLKGGNLPLIRVARQTYTWNAFLKAFDTDEAFFRRDLNKGWRSDGLVRIEDEHSIFWADILHAMRRPYALESHGRKPSSSLEPPKPGQITWNIILNAFARRGIEAETEHILGMAKSQGFKPDAHTWNSILSGYVRMGQNEVTAGLLNRMRLANFPGDEHTVAALKLVKDRRTLLETTKEYASGTRVPVTFVRSRGLLRKRSTKEWPGLAEHVMENATRRRTLNPKSLRQSTWRITQRSQLRSFDRPQTGRKRNIWRPLWSVRVHPASKR